MSAARSARRPVPALIFLLVLAVLAVVVWVRVSGRDSTADAGGGASCGVAPQLPALASVTVTVINANGGDQLATRTRDQFVAYGFASGNVGNADSTAPGIATITAGPNGAGSALLVSYYLPGATVVADARQDLGVTVTVGTEFTGLATPEAAASSEAQATVSATPPAAASPSPGETTVTTAPTAPSSPAPTCLTTPPFPTPSAFVTASS